VGQREGARKQCNLITFVKWQGRVTALGISLMCARQKIEGDEQEHCKRANTYSQQQKGGGAEVEYNALQLSNLRWKVKQGHHSRYSNDLSIRRGGVGRERRGRMNIVT
jgi:hypothetical protein